MSPGLAPPTYRRTGRRAGIVHLGFGGFHRAHQAAYLDDLAHLEDLSDWAIVGAELRDDQRRMHEVMGAQEHLYTLVLKHPDGTWQPRTIGSVAGHLHAPDDPEALLRLLAAPTTRIVTLTITEGGYGIDPATNDFDPSDPDMRADLAGGGPPRSALGFLAVALARRRVARIAPFTVLSCDNIQGNGDTARSALTAFAAVRDPESAAWIEANVAFPNAMVDRITPTTSEADRLELITRFGIRDRWPVFAEPFRQWIIEDHFPTGRPGLERVGVQFVPDVRPYEQMKLRLLNAGHQVIAYSGVLAGYRFVHEAAADPELAGQLSRYLDEAIPTIEPLPGIDLDDYARTILERFANPELADTLERICAFGSDRIQTFVLPVIRARLDDGVAATEAIAAVAAWARYIRTRPDLVDRRRDDLLRAAAGLDDDPSRFLSTAGIFDELAVDPRFLAAFADALNRSRP